MSVRRKDNKGRVLQKGESQRENGSYMYRYKDRLGKMQCKYAKTLDELRRIEDEIDRDLLYGIDHTAREMIVTELLDRFINLKKDSIKQTTRSSYETAISITNNSGFGSRRIKDIRVSDAKVFLQYLHEEGRKPSSVKTIQSILRHAFEIAVEDDLIRKNPFRFDPSTILSDNSDKRTALTREQLDSYMDFVVNDYKSGFADDIIILLGTGLRVSELYGLTISDLDFESRCIHIRKQLCKVSNRSPYISAPKTKSGVRDIPMTDAVYDAFKRVLSKRKKLDVEPVIDGYSEFVFISKFKTPRLAQGLECQMRFIMREYIKKYGNTVPTVTPHVLRHTFCTVMAQSGLGIKNLQYLMGHSNINITLNVYTHHDYDSIERDFMRVAEITPL